MIIIGHRGCQVPGVFENTLQSFQKALDLGVDMIELDVFLTLDNKIVVCHDRHLDRLIEQSLEIEQTTLGQLQQYLLPNGETIPTLASVIKLVDRVCPINIELKSQSSKILPPLDTLLSHYFQQGWERHHFLVSSYNLTLLQQLSVKNPSIMLGIIQGNILPDPYYYLDFSKKVNSVVSIHIDKELYPSLLQQKIIKAYKKNNLHVYIFTVNYHHQVSHQDTLVDGIITDRPDYFSKLV